MSVHGEELFMTLMQAVFKDIPARHRAAHIRDRTAIFYFLPPLVLDAFKIPRVTTYQGRMFKLTLDVNARKEIDAE